MPIGAPENFLPSGLSLPDTILARLDFRHAENALLSTIANPHAELSLFALE
jgi:hypothetical protein